MRKSCTSVVVLVGILFVACGSDDETQRLVTRLDGEPTGDGTTCSWEDTALFAKVTAASPAPTPAYALGDEFSSIDGCRNACTCTAKGITCATKTCQLSCVGDTKVCSNGVTVERIPPSCAFAPCPGDPPICTVDAKKNGLAFVPRCGPTCTFDACTLVSTHPASCHDYALTCPTGAGTADISCYFTCPQADCAELITAAAKTSCMTDPDCAKACQPFDAAGCTVEAPPCHPTRASRCVNQVCQ